VSYHPDPVIDAEVAAVALEAERADLSIGYPPRFWECPQCGNGHTRGHFLAIGQHRCLHCGYVGGGGVMSLPDGGP
jgi:rubredoxin